jgi:hypothetical protein
MISPKQLEANKKNAIKSTGPKSPEGKAVVAQNAVKYGLFAKLEVLPGMERQEDWEDHHSQVMADLAPEGRMEVLLAERVALQMWRLARTARYEREVTATALENAERDLPGNPLRLNYDPSRTKTPLEDANLLLGHYKELTAFIEAFPRDGEKPDKPLRFAYGFVHVVNKVAGIGGKDEVDPAMAALASKGSRAMTVGDLRGWIGEVAKARGMEADVLFDSAVRHACDELDKAETEHKRVTRLLAQSKRRRMIPSDAESQKIQRYEAHLERSLYKALHELQRMQSVRRGQPVPPPVALDVDVSTPAEGN